MIEIEIHSREGQFTGLRAKGHASLDSGSKGMNPVCAGVSVLIQTLVLFFKKHKLIDRMVKEKDVLAFHLIDIRNPKLTVMVDQSFQMVLTGLEDLLKSYPEEIRMEFVEENFLETRRVS